MEACTHENMLDHPNYNGSNRKPSANSRAHGLRMGGGGGSRYDGEGTKQGEGTKRHTLESASNCPEFRGVLSTRTGWGILVVQQSVLEKVLTRCSSRSCTMLVVLTYADVC
jgi:hypothetical protein